MANNFKSVERKGSGSIKWDFQVKGDQLPFTVADSDYASPKCVATAIKKRADEGHFGYTKLDDNYFKAIQGWYKKVHKVGIDKDWIVPVTGVIVGIKVILETISYRGDKVVIMTPVYSTFTHLLESMERKIITSELINENENYRFDYNDLETKFKKGAHILLLCSPHNPIGRVWKKDELTKLVDLCRKYSVTIISDEIHSDLIMPGVEFTSMLTFKNYYNRLYVVAAPTKTFNLAGLLTGYIIVPNEINRNACQKYQQTNFMPGVNILAATATKEVYLNSEAYEWMEDQNKHIYHNYELVKKTLESKLPNASLPKLEGTYILWINFNCLKLSDEIIVKRLADNGVLVNKGSEYGENYRSYVRMCVACSEKQLKEGLNRMIKALK